MLVSIMMEHVSRFLWEVRVLLMWVFSPAVPGAKAANPYNEINQKAPLLPAR